MSSSGEKLGVLLNVLECTRQTPSTKHDWALNVNNANEEKPSLTDRGTEVIKVTISREGLGTSVYLVSHILKWSSPGQDAPTGSHSISFGTEPHSGKPNAA